MFGIFELAVQNERDCIRSRRHNYDSQNDSYGLSVRTLLNAELITRQHHDNNLENKRVATAKDVFESMKDQLLLLVNWAKQIPAFSQLDMGDQMILIKARAGEQLLLGVCHRSFNVQDILLLGNDYFIPRHPPLTEEKMVNWLGCRVMDQLLKPLREVQIDDTEFACLKAIVFFDPNSLGLINKAKIKELRYQVQLNLEDYINDSQYESRGRFGDILLILPTLQAIAWQMIEEIQFAKYFGIQTIDDFLQEMLLEGRARDPSSGLNISLMLPPQINPESPLQIPAQFLADSGPLVEASHKPNSQEEVIQSLDTIKIPPSDTYKLESRLPESSI